MPKIDLRDPTDRTNLKKNASIEVQAVMLFPNSRPDREQFKANHGPNTGTISRRPRQKLIEFKDELERRMFRGADAGWLYMTQIQFHQQGFPHSLNNAIRIAQHTAPQGGDWDARGKHVSRSKHVLLGLFQEFRNIAHAWCAFWYARQNNFDTEVSPDRLETLPRFLGYSELIAELYRKQPATAYNRRPEDDHKQRWQFVLPKAEVIRPRIRALPIPGDWEAKLRGRSQ